MSYRSRISSELSCLSSGLPSALFRSLLSSSTARRYSACSSPGGYVAVTNFDNGLTRSTSEDFFNGTEINVAIWARGNDTVLVEKWEHCRRTKTKAEHFLVLSGASSRQMYCQSGACALENWPQFLYWFFLHIKSFKILIYTYPDSYKAIF